MQFSEEVLLNGGVFLFLLTSLVAVKVELSKRPTFRDSEKKFRDQPVCDERHKSVEEKLNCIPEVKDTLARVETKVDLLIASKSNLG